MSNVPKLRFKEFSGVWEEKAIKDVANIVGGGTPDTTVKEYWNGTIQWFTPTEIKSKYIDNSKRTITELGLKKSSAKILPKGSLLLSTRATVGDIGIAVNECTTNQGFQSLIVNEDNYNIFIYNWILINKKLFLQKSSGSTFMEISKKEIEKIKIIIPTKQEQEKIASFLTSVDTKIEQLTKKESLLQEYKKGVMQKIFNQEIRFKDDDGSEFCDWEEKRLGEVTEFRRGSFPQPYGLSKWYDNEKGMPFIQVFDVDKNMKLKENSKTKISKLAQPMSVFVERNNILVTIQGSIGRIALTQYDSYVDRTLLIFTKYLIPINKIYFTYILFLLFDIEKKKAPGGIIKTITKEVLTKFKVQIPTIDEQTKIANFLSSIDTKIEHTQKQLKQTKEFKKALLQQMFI